MVTQPERRVTDIPLLREDERHRLELWNAMRVNWPLPRTIHHAFEAQAAQSPERVALVEGDAILTYEALNRRANQLAHYLWRRGVGPEMPIGICAERSIDMVVGLLGILKAGGTYVPLDPTYPQERLAYMARHAQVRLILAQSHVQEVVLTTPIWLASPQPIHPPCLVPMQRTSSTPRGPLGYPRVSSVGTRPR